LTTLTSHHAPPTQLQTEVSRIITICTVGINVAYITYHKFISHKSAQVYPASKGANVDSLTTVLYILVGKLNRY